MKVFSVLSVLALVALTAAATPMRIVESSGASEPLFLTKYLSDPATGRQLSEITELGWPYPMYSGYFTVNETTGSNQFFWFTPAMNGDVDAPVVVWLQGGPGVASMFGLFSENGPFSVAENLTLIPREISWSSTFNMIWIDNPVGAGFSFTTSEEGFVRNENDVANDLYSTVTQFFTIFPEYLDNDFYVAGESYGGKYAPSLAYKIYEENLAGPDVYINLVGLSVGDGAMSPLDQMTNYADFLNDVGLTSSAQAEFIHTTFDKPTAAAIEVGDYYNAFLIFDSFLNGDFISPTYFQNITGLTNYFNLMNPVYPVNPYPSFLNLTSVKEAIHVGSNQYWDYNKTTEFHLIGDWMVSIAWKLPTLMNNIKVLMYNGQLDLILGRALAEPFYESIEWDGQDAYNAAPHQIWTLADGTVAGYAQQSQPYNYTVVTVLGAGHMVPADQPAAAYDMINRFINDLPYSKNPQCCK